MIRLTHAIIVTTGVVGLIGSALAADMTGAKIKTLVSYSSADTMSSSTGSMAGTKKIRMACYPARTGCTKDSDCCSGHCQTFSRASYCTR